MINVSDLYKNMSLANGRNIDVKVNINSKDFAVEVLEFNIQHELSTEVKDILVGKAPSARLSLKLNTSISKVPSRASIKPYIRFTSGDGGTVTEWLQLGEYFSNYRYADKGVLSVTAYDRMYFLDEKYSTELSTYTDTEILTEMGEKFGFKIAVETVGYDLIVAPTGYTNREVLAYIASLYGGNAIFNNEGAFDITVPGGTDNIISLANCTSQSIDTSPYELKRVVCTVSTILTYKSSDTGSDYDTLAFNNPYMTETAFENIKKLIGLKVCNMTLKKQGTGFYKLGESFSVADYNNQSIQVPGIISFIEYEFKDGVFKENITSSVRTEVDGEYTRENDLTSEFNNVTENLTEVVYTCENNDQIILSDTSIEIINIKLTTNHDCVPVFQASINTLFNSGGVVIFEYYLDDIQYFLTPMQTVTEGYYILNLFCPLSFKENTTHEFKVLCYTSGGATGQIDKRQCQAIIRGQGLTTTGANWDGRLSIVETIGLISIDTGDDIEVKNFNESISVNTQTPVPSGVTETIGRIEIENVEIIISGIDTDIFLTDKAGNKLTDKSGNNLIGG